MGSTSKLAYFNDNNVVHGIIIHKCHPIHGIIIMHGPGPIGIPATK